MLINYKHLYKWWLEHAKNIKTQGKHSGCITHRCTSSIFPSTSDPKRRRTAEWLVHCRTTPAISSLPKLQTTQDRIIVDFWACSSILHGIQMTSYAIMHDCLNWYYFAQACIFQFQVQPNSEEPAINHHAVASISKKKGISTYMGVSKTDGIPKWMV